VKFKKLLLPTWWDILHQKHIHDKNNKMNKEEVLKIVDECFHSYASFYRQDAKELAEELIEELPTKEVLKKELLVNFCDSLFKQEGTQITDTQIDFLISKYKL